jgi:hypothetical protein
MRAAFDESFAPYGVVFITQCWREEKETRNLGFLYASGGHHDVGLQSWVINMVMLFIIASLDQVVYRS